MASHKARHRLFNERGTAMVEFAIVGIIFLGLIYGAISYGVMFWVKSVVTHAAEEGARAAIGGIDPTDSINKAKSKAADVIDKGLPAAYAKYSDLTTPSPSGATPPQASIAPCASDPAASCITLTVKYPYKTYPVLPALPPVFPILPDELKSTSVVQLTN